MDTEFGRTEFGEPKLTIELIGGSDIFRFAINMLNWQCEFGEAAREALSDLRGQLTPARFDPFAKSLLGEDRYAKLADRFEPVRDEYSLVWAMDRRRSPVACHVDRVGDGHAVVTHCGLALGLPVARGRVLPAELAKARGRRWCTTCWPSEALVAAGESSSG